MSRTKAILLLAGSGTAIMLGLLAIVTLAFAAGGTFRLLLVRGSGGVMLAAVFLGISVVFGTAIIALTRLPDDSR